MSGELGRLFREIDNSGGWTALYDKIRNDSTKSSLKLPLKVAKASQNVKLNRYRDVLPFDHSRVMLPSGSYINASHVRVDKAGRDYILTQGPLPETAENFWEMVWHQNSRAVIMLNKIIEKNQIKCHQYFPVGEKSVEHGPSSKNKLKFGDFEIQLSHQSECKHYTVRTLSLINVKLKQHREILHFQFITWPDFGVPQCTHDFLEFLNEVRMSDVLNLSLHGPPVVHCSAGIGRSGTFIIVDAILIMAKKSIDFSTIDIVKIITDLRQYRMGLIQTHDQLKFCWKSIVDALENEKWRPMLAATSTPSEDGDASLRSSLTNGRSLQRCVGYLPTAESLSSVEGATCKNDAIDKNSGDFNERTDVSGAVGGQADDTGASYRQRRNVQKKTSGGSQAGNDDDAEVSHSKRRKSSAMSVETTSSVDGADVAESTCKKRRSAQDDESLLSYTDRARQREIKSAEMRAKIDRIQVRLREKTGWLIGSQNFLLKHNFLALASGGFLLGSVFGLYCYFFR